MMGDRRSFCMFLFVLVFIEAVAAAGQAQLLQTDSQRSLLGEKRREHHYKAGDEVELLANKVGPFANPRCEAIGTGHIAGLSVVPPDTL